MTGTLVPSISSFCHREALADLPRELRYTPSPAACSRGRACPAGSTRTTVRYCTRPITYSSALTPLVVLFRPAPRAECTCRSGTATVSGVGALRRVAQPGQRIGELLDAAPAQVARAGVGDRDARDGADLHRRRRSRAGTCTGRATSAMVTEAVACVYPEPGVSTVTDVTFSVATATAPAPGSLRIGSNCVPSRIATTGADEYPEPGVTSTMPVMFTTPGVPSGFGLEQLGCQSHTDVRGGLRAVGIIRQAERDRRDVVPGAARCAGLRVSESTSPNAVAVAPCASAADGHLRLRVPRALGCGSTAMEVTEPVGLKVAVAARPVPHQSPSIVTPGAAVYPLPNLVMVMPVMTPPTPTWAVASAVTPPGVAAGRS